MLSCSPFKFFTLEQYSIPKLPINSSLIEFKENKYEDLALVPSANVFKPKVSCLE